MLNSIILLFYEEFIQMIIADKSNLVVFYGHDCCNSRAISSIIVVTDSGMTRDQENIEKEPSTGGKAVRGFGYVLLGIGVLVLLATFTIGVARNLLVLVLVSSSDTSTVHSIQLAVDARP
jgi:hypothetical protein